MTRSSLGCHFWTKKTKRDGSSFFLPQWSLHSFFSLSPICLPGSSWGINMFKESYSVCPTELCNQQPSFYLRLALKKGKKKFPLKLLLKREKGSSFHLTVIKLSRTRSKDYVCINSRRQSNIMKVNSLE